MKYIVLLCDGMADIPCPDLGGHTPMEAAVKPNMDALAKRAEVGIVRTVPEGMTPGSDVANLAVMGYDAKACYTGRSPLEAANIGIELADDDVAFRCNLVTLSDAGSYEDRNMQDYCAGDIHTQEAREIINSLQEAFGGGEFDYYTGTAYRHCFVWHGGKTALGKLTPPHDIPGRRIGEYLPAYPDAAPLLDMMRRSCALLENHPVNQKRRQAGLSPANAIWLWGQGKRPQLENFTQRHHKTGAVISAVDLLKGIGRIAGMKVCDVPGATGYIDTNFSGKMQAAVDELRAGCDFVYIHVEAPDECGHRGEVQNKVKAIEEIDRQILGPLLEQMEGMTPYSLLILPDHPTPLAIRTHSAEPVPYLLYRSNRETDGCPVFTEQAARDTGRFVEVGYTLIDRLFSE